mgnify:CR=1 FL=1
MGAKVQLVRDVKLSRSFYLPFSLLLEAEEEAKRRRVPVSRIVEEALRLFLSQRAEERVKAYAAMQAREEERGVGSE